MTKAIEKLKWVEPYQKKRKTGTILRTLYDVYFEDTCLLTDCGCELADQLVAILNGAYNLGRTHERLEQEFNKDVNV